MSSDTSHSTSQSSNGSAQAKRMRTSKPKVKTGCSSCKQRRIKCDEKRPACTQCIRGQKTCTGYPPPSRRDMANISLPLAPKPQLASSSSGLLALTPATYLQPALATVRVPVRRNIPERDDIPPPRRAVIARQRKMIARRKVEPPAQASLFFLQPSVGIPFKGTEELYFQLFRVRTVAELSGYFDDLFWTRTVLQECHREPAIRHAVLALGALYKTLEQSSEAMLGSYSPTYSTSSTSTSGPNGYFDLVASHWQAAVREYSEACKAIMSLGVGTHGTHRTRLMASVLLACFDSFIGDHKQAVVQIQTGLSLLDQIQTAQRNHIGCRSTEPQVEEDLVVIFNRLAIQAKSYDLAFHFPEPYVIRLNTRQPTSPELPESPSSSPIPEIVPPTQFYSLREARVASDRLYKKMLRFIERLYALKMAASSSQRANPLPASWIDHAFALKKALEAWSLAFEPIFQSRFRAGIDPLEKTGIAAVKMFQINVQIVFAMMFGGSEDQFDAYVPQFQAIVDLGQEVIREDERRSQADRCAYPEHCRHRHQYMWDTSTAVPTCSAYHVRPSFSADMGIVPPLFVVATKCREPSIRRKAILLLRGSARREGMWDSEMISHIAEWIMTLEEEQQLREGDLKPRNLYTIPSTKTRPENLVMIKSVDFDLRTRVAKLTVGTRTAHDPSGMDSKWRATQIAW